MDFDRHCAEIVAQTELLTGALEGADLRAPVPSCPGWSLGMLLRHIGGGHRWATEMVRTRATGFLPDDQIRDVAGDDSGPVPAEWLLSGAKEFAGALREAGPDTEVWAVFHYHTMTFWARRFANETTVHRADAMLAAGVPFSVDPAMALEGIEEWLELDALPEHFDITPEKRDLLGPGRTLVLAATDADAAWFLDLTGDVIQWRRGVSPAAVTVRAPLKELVLLVYRRASPADVEVEGDRELLDFWLSHVAFGWSARASAATVSSRPGNRCSNSARRRRTYVPFPASRCTIRPASRSARQWCVFVDFATGIGKDEHARSVSDGSAASSASTARRCGSASARNT
ncbi:TIGR03083 family protein [Amycolatopsis sacchari]|uniref:TIGR03083 family protein n=1 Tax=Amycolatopsis sacchari TaxID=115433 RepID=A0A1I3R0Y9_9PSEU|nr:TIGR03083 family protein [Amycolatopsis sacchari]